jgi:hypothetical protein
VRAAGHDVDIPAFCHQISSHRRPSEGWGLSRVSVSRATFRMSSAPTTVTLNLVQGPSLVSTLRSMWHDGC